MMESEGHKAVCLAEQENGHGDAYLVHVHQADGTEYAKCSTCGWIKPEKWNTRTHANEAMESAVESNDKCDYCFRKNTGRCTQGQCFTNGYRDFVGRRMFPSATPQPAKKVEGSPPCYDCTRYKDDSPVCGTCKRNYADYYNGTACTPANEAVCPKDCIHLDRGCCILGSGNHCVRRAEDYYAPAPQQKEKPE